MLNPFTMLVRAIKLLLGIKDEKQEIQEKKKQGKQEELKPIDYPSDIDPDKLGEKPFFTELSALGQVIERKDSELAKIKAEEGIGLKYYIYLHKTYAGDGTDEEKRLHLEAARKFYTPDKKEDELSDLHKMTKKDSYERTADSITAYERIPDSVTEYYRRLTQDAIKTTKKKRKDLFSSILDMLFRRSKKKNDDEEEQKNLTTLDYFSRETTKTLSSRKKALESDELEDEEESHEESNEGPDENYMLRPIRSDRSDPSDDFALSDRSAFSDLSDRSDDNNTIVATVDGDNNNKQKNGKKGPALEVFGTNITILARQGKLEECYGRDNELLEMMEILVRRQKNNPVLLGDAGVGKTAIIELFASKIVNNVVPFVLEGRSIVSIDLARVVGGSRYRGEFEGRLQRIIDEVLAQPHIIMFIDEIHTLSGTGAAEGSLDAANILKPILSRSGFQCIGATTTKEYQKIEKDPALNRRFQPIHVKEPSVEQTLDILYGLQANLESFHNVTFLPGTMRIAAELASRYIYDRFLPDKAIDIVDRVAAKEVIKATNIVSGSVVGAVLNKTLTDAGKLKLECYRRGDLATQFIFQEVENAYRRCLMTWVENPLSITDSEKKEGELDIKRKALHSISDDLVLLMRSSVLKQTEKLLFASPTPRFVTKLIHKDEDLAPKINFNKFKKLEKDLLLKQKPKASLYRIALYLATRIIKKNEEEEILNYKPIIQKKEEQTKGIIYVPPFYTEKKRHFSTLMQDVDYKKVHQLWFLLKTNKMIQHFERMQKIPNFVTHCSDFLVMDTELIKKKREILSEIEAGRVGIVVDFLKQLRPLLKKGLVQSLTQNPDLKLSKEDVGAIKALLGYFSTDEGHQLLVNFEDEKIIKQAREERDFTILKRKIGSEQVKTLISSITGVPIQSISALESEKLLKLEHELHNRVIGQQDAVRAIARAIRRSRLGIQNPNRPLASFLFCGPTGVGKTEVTKALASILFGSENEMIRFDMSEFMEKFTISRLIGSPPGYIGYEDGGQLSDAVRRRPYSVVLFDEIEKAHPDVLNILLQILEDGRLTDNQKRLIPFENTVIIMTSNAGADDIQRILKEKSVSDADKIKQQTQSQQKNEQSEQNKEKEEKVLLKEKQLSEKAPVQFFDPYGGTVKFLDTAIRTEYLEDLSAELTTTIDLSYRKIIKEREEMIKAIKEKNKEKLEIEGENKDTSQESESNPVKNAVLDRLSHFFLPEFLNRLDDIIIFRPLTVGELREICDIMLKQVFERISKKDIKLEVTNEVKDKLTRDAYNPAFGARPLRRLITKHIEDFVSDFLLKNAEKSEKSQDSENTEKGKVISVKLILDTNGNIIVDQTEEKEQQKRKEKIVKPIIQPILKSSSGFKDEYLKSSVLTEPTKQPEHKEHGDDKEIKQTRPLVEVEALVESKVSKVEAEKKPPKEKLENNQIKRKKNESKRKKK